MSDPIKSLKQIGLLSQLTEQELADLAARCRWRSFTDGELIIGHQDRSFDVLFLVSGMARVSIYSVTGKLVSFRDIRPGDIVGELSAIDEKPRSASVESIGRSMFLAMPQAVFHDLLKTRPVVLFALLRHLTRQVRALTARVFEFSTLAVRNRVHAELVRLARNGTTGGKEAVIAPAPTHSEIASRISTHREAVTRELNRLEDLNIIAKEGRTLKVLDLPRLASMVDELTADSPGKG